MLRPSREILSGAFLLAAILVSGGCADRIVEVDRPLFEDPPPHAGDFLGYSNTAVKRTVCGNCHLGMQAEWQETAHADAWATLQAATGQQAFCQACHTVSSRGNFVQDENVGWVSTSNTRYHDVQCEACHGPGLLHVTNPDANSTKPLAPLSVGVDLTRGCGQCHSGVHRPFVEEWAESRHANIRPAQASNPSCRECHEGRAFLENAGLDLSFAEKNDPAHMPTTCGVCHDPHSAQNSGQLRFPIDVPDVEKNLCMMCHHKRGEPDLGQSAFRGPHSPEGPLLLGEAGWWPPGFEYPRGSIVGTHGSDANPRLCAGCHVNDYQLRDPLTNAFEFRATGHSFQAIPCVDATGRPTGERNCAITERSFQACATCHGTRAPLALTDSRAQLNFLISVIEPLIAQVPASEMNRAPGTPFSTGEGARFNMELAKMRGSEVHNPFLVRALLLASIAQLEEDYGIRPSVAPGSLTNQLSGH